MLQELRNSFKLIVYCFWFALIPFAWPTGTDSSTKNRYRAFTAAHLILFLPVLGIIYAKKIKTFITVGASMDEEDVLGYLNLTFFQLRATTNYIFMLLKRKSMADFVEQVFQSMTKTCILDVNSNRIIYRVKVITYIASFWFIFVTGYITVIIFRNNGVAAKEWQMRSSDSGVYEVIELLPLPIYMACMWYCMCLMGIAYILNFYILHLINLRIKIYEEDLHRFTGKHLSDNKLWHFQEEHRNLCLIINQYNSVFSLINTIIFINEVVEIILLVKIVGTTFTTSDVESVAWPLILAFKSMAVCIAKIIFWSSINTKIWKTLYNTVDLATINNNSAGFCLVNQSASSVMANFHIYTIRMSLSPSFISALGFFDMKSGLIASVAATVVTYVLMLYGIN
ncbi:hypothetical protein CHUAL_007109 [Chamberlinius hualienensis]